MTDLEVYFLLALYALGLLTMVGTGFLIVAGADAFSAWRRGASPRQAFIEFWREG